MGCSCVSGEKKLESSSTNLFFHLKYGISVLPLTRGCSFAHFEVTFYTYVQKKLSIIMQFIASVFISIFFQIEKVLL